MIDTVYDRLGFEMPSNEKHLTIALRKLVAKWACKLEHPRCLKEATSQFVEWMNTSNPNIQNS